MVKDVKYGFVFEKTEQALAEGHDNIFHMGGTGSGKTYDLMLLVVYLAISNPNKIITVVSESYPHLEIGTLRYAQKIINDFNLSDSITFNKSKLLFTFNNNTILEFFSADRIEKALGARRWLLYGNEINTLKFEIWDELARRSKIVIGDFNPTAEFWLERYLSLYGKHQIIKSNYLNNPFLPIEEFNRIKRRAEIDATFKRTHVDVEYGSLEGLIFEKFDIVQEFPEDCKWISYGMDFGFTNDPSTFIKVGLKDDTLFFDELFYQTGLLASDICKLFNNLKITYSDHIVADNKPEAIYEINKNGFNVKQAYKPAGSIVAGIEIVKEYKLAVTVKSLNLIKELRNYKWKTEKNGLAINQPIDSFNHAIDAIRYAVMARRFSPTRLVRVSSV